MQDKVYLDVQNFEEYVEQIEEFDNSIFAGVYDALYKVVNAILSEKNKKRGDIITVLGERGSGKSSLMLSFTQSLEKKSNKYIKWENVQFSVMENLDASMLDSSEDIFDILLSRMLKNIEKYIENGKFSVSQNRRNQYDILQQIDEIYKIHQLIKREGKEGGSAEQLMGYSSLSTLRNAADSLELTRKFENLVENYLEALLESRGGSREQKNYLVVPIDDLDMNNENGFKSLEKLYRYVSVKNVIVVIAVKYRHIMYLAEKEGYSIFPKIDRELDDSKVKYVKDYAKEYLAKLLPIQGRVHMPDMLIDQQVIQEKWFVKGGKKSYTIKESILFKVKEKTGMCFDICGKKMHFLIPDSLRELKGYYGYLDSQPDGSQSNNIEQFVSDFLNRNTNRKLEYSQRELLLSLCELEYGEIHNRLIDILENTMAKAGRRHIRVGLKRSYGELLYELYLISRSIWSERKFVDAVLVFYTYHAQREQLKIDKDKKGAGWNNIIGELFPSSWIGNWSNFFVPMINNEEMGIDEKVSTNSILMASIETIDTKMWGYLEKVNAGDARIGVEWENCAAKSADEWIKKYTDKIKIFEWVCFFFEEFYSKLNEIEDVRLKIERKDENRIEWTIANKKVDFNILAFIKHSYYYEEYFERLHTAIAEALVVEFGEKKENIQKLKKKLKESGLYSKYKKWFKTCKGIAVPFQYPDIYYHLLCKLKYQLQAQMENEIKSEDVIDILQLVFKKIETLLNDEDEGYKGIGGTKFVEAFKTCPFVDMLLNEVINWEVKEKRKFGEMVNRCSACSISSRRYNRARTELTTSDDITFREYDW